MILVNQSTGYHYVRIGKRMCENISFPAVHLAKKQKLHACSQHPRLQLAPALAASTHARSHHDMRAASTGGGAQAKKKLNITQQTLKIRLTRSKFKDL